MKDMVRLGDDIRVGRYALMAWRLFSQDSGSGLEREVKSNGTFDSYNGSGLTNYDQKTRVIKLRESRRKARYGGKHEWRRNYVNRVDREKDKMYRNLSKIERKLELITMNEYSGLDSNMETHTNDILQLYGFVSERERNQLFLAYGKDAVRRGLDLFYILNISPTKEKLVATIDSAARNGYANTGRMLNNELDIVANVRQHYQQLSSLQPKDFEGNHDSLTYLVRKYIFGEDVNLPEPVVIKVEPSTRKTPSYITEFSQYSADGTKDINSRLTKDGLRLDDVMEEGIFIRDVEGYHFIFNDVLAVLAGMGIKPNRFQAIEKTHELDRSKSNKSGIEYVRLAQYQTDIGVQFGKADLKNILNATYRDNPLQNVFTPEGIIKILDREN